MSSHHLALVEALAAAIDAKDQTSLTHIRRVRRHATAVARALGMRDADVQGLEIAATLHDIGKLAVPEHILSRPGPLTAEEFQKIRAHPDVGADIIGAVPFPFPVASLIRCHHERWDGKGYPAGLKGEEIPLGARVLSVVDYFDALTTERPYHKAMTQDAAVALLQQEAGNGLDPDIVATFIGLLPRFLEEDEAQESAAIPDAGPVAAPVFDDIALAHREIYARAVHLQRRDRRAELPLRHRHGRRPHPAARRARRRGPDRLGRA